MAEQPRRSRRLQGKQPERDAIDSLCVICLLSISIKFFNCMITKCCNRPIHRPCWNEALKYKSRCPRCRTRQGVQYPDNVNPRRLPGNWERVGYAREISTSKNNFSFCFIFSNHDYCCEWNLKYYVFFFKSPAFPTELERLPERLFISLIEDFIDVEQTTAFNTFQYRLAFDSVVNCVFLCLLRPITVQITELKSLPLFIKKIGSCRHAYQQQHLL